MSDAPDTAAPAAAPGGESQPEVTTREILGWCMYDVADSPFTTVIVTAIFAIYFREAVVGDAGRADALWGRAGAISQLVVAALAPLLGAIADFSGSRKKFLAACVGVVVLFTAALYFVGPGMAMLGFVLFVIANVGFAGGGVFIDSFLPGISTPQNAGRISGAKWAMGYASGLVALVICLPLANSLDAWRKGEPPPAALTVPEDAVPVKVTLAVAAGTPVEGATFAVTRDGTSDAVPPKAVQAGAPGEAMTVDFLPGELWKDKRDRRAQFGIDWTDAHERAEIASAAFGVRVHGGAVPAAALSLTVHHRTAAGAEGRFELTEWESRPVASGVERHLRGGRDAGKLATARLVPLVIAIYFLLAVIPTFLFLRERTQKQPLPEGSTLLTVGFTRLRDTFRQIGHYRELVKLFIAFLIYNEGVVTVIFFAALYAVGTVGFESGEVTIMFLVINIVALAGALGFGWLADRVGQKRIILVTLVLWIAAVLLAAAVPTRAAFWGVATLAGLGIGSTQSVTRSLVALFTPKSRASEFFGFLGVAGKALAFTGPLVFGEVSNLLGQRAAVLSVGVFFVAGGAVLLTVNEAKGKAAALEDAA